MLRLIGSAIGALILAGLGLALLITFNWDVGAIFEWGIGFVTDLVNTVAGWFMGWSVFQDAVSS